MKTAVYIEENKQQIVLTPENKYEVQVLKSIKNRHNQVDFYYGSFSTCYGGYIRRYNQGEMNEDSLMMFIKQIEVEEN